MLFLPLLHEVLLVPAGTLVSLTTDIFKLSFHVGVTIFPLLEKGTLTLGCLLLELYKIVSKALIVDFSALRTAT